MKAHHFIYILFSVSCGCGRAPDQGKTSDTPTPMPEPAVAPEPPPAAGRPPAAPADPHNRVVVRTAPAKVEVSIQARAQNLIARIPGTEFISEENIAALVTMVPELKSSGLFWHFIGAVPGSQRGPFRDAIVASLQALRPTPGQPVHPEFREAFSIAKDLRDTEIARVAFEQLPLVEPYQIPNTPAPQGWPVGTQENMERLVHGNQGTLAEAVVEGGNPQTLANYREFLKKAKPEAQRTLIWALGRSTELQDFELLMEMRGRTSDPGVVDTLTRALNRIPQSMETAAKFPATVPADRRPANAEDALKVAAQCKARLAAQGLRVQTTIFD